MNFKIKKMPKSKKILRKKLTNVQLPLSEENKEAIEWMIKYIDNSQKPGFKKRPGVGIAANQIGLDLKMFYVNIPSENKKEKPYKEFLINPQIIGKSESTIALEHGEGCLSVPENTANTEGLVNRWFKVIIKGYSYFSKKEIKIAKTGYCAIVLQHEMDHLNGKLFFDKINQEDKWKNKKNAVLI